MVLSVVPAFKPLDPVPALKDRKYGSTLILFDVDGTLAVPAQLAKPETVDMLAKLRKLYAVGMVGAADFEQQQRQLGGHDMRLQFDFVFSENGVHAFRDGNSFGHHSRFYAVYRNIWLS
jgi:hydroxymethylpyrimidine pyrophosphatase-like HAD family hydrolase